MRYLVQKLKKQKQIHFWEDENCTHTLYATQNGISLEDVSSVGYIYYDPDNKKWILTGAVSWMLENNAQRDKRHVRAFAIKHFQKDAVFMERLSAQWHNMQKRNEQVKKNNPLLVRFINKILDRE